MQPTHVAFFISRSLLLPLHWMMMRTISGLSLLVAATSKKSCHNFIVITQQRSGSLYFIKKLKTHPNIDADTEPFSNTRWGKQTRTFEETSAEVTRVLHNKCSKKQRNTHVGFKWMTNQHHGEDPIRMSEWLGGTQTKLLFLWRRSLLRQYISEIVMVLKPDAAHPSSQAEAAIIANVTVKLRTGQRLVHKLEKRFKARSRVAAYYAALPSRTFYYEDTVESSEHYNETWSEILNFLDVPDIALAAITDSVVIHANKPILDPVRNAGEVQNSLRQVCSTNQGRRWGTTCDELGWVLAGHSNTKVNPTRRIVLTGAHVKASPRHVPPMSRQTRQK